MIESKSLEILKEMAKGKQVDMIVERGQGLSSWIRFGGRDLAMFLVGFELCCDSKNRKPLRMEWKEGEWVNKLELCSNNVHSFLYCLVWSAEGKIFSLIFPEARVFQRDGGSKLRSIDVVPLPILGKGPLVGWLSMEGACRRIPSQRCLLCRSGN